MIGRIFFSMFFFMKLSLLVHLIRRENVCQTFYSQPYFAKNSDYKCSFHAVLMNSWWIWSRANEKISDRSEKRLVLFNFFYIFLSPLNFYCNLQGSWFSSDWPHLEIKKITILWFFLWLLLVLHLWSFSEAMLKIAIAIT